MRTGASSAAHTSTPIPRLRLAQYGLGSLGTGIFSTVPSVLLLYFMTNTLAVSAALAGLAVSLPKLLDVIVDPLIGSLSDRTNSRWGRRLPYLLVGSIAMSITFVMLFAVPDIAHPVGRFWYVAIVFTISAAAYSVFAVPYIAMPAEMSNDPEERTVIVAWRMTFALIGVLAGSAGAPFLVVLAGGGRAGYATMSLIVGIACGLAMLAAFDAARKLPTRGTAGRQTSLRSTLRAAVSNRPFVVLLGTYVVQLAGLGAFSAAVPYFASQVLGKNDSYVGLIFLCLVGCAAVSALFWPTIARNLGRRCAYGVAAFAYAVANLTILFSTDNFPVFFASIVVMGVGFGGMQVLPFAMLTDTIEFDLIRSGMRREGLFTGIWTAGEKAGLALGPLIVGTVLSRFGYIESNADHVLQPPSAIFGIRIAACAIPALLLAASLIILTRYRMPGRVAESSARHGLPGES